MRVAAGGKNRLFALVAFLYFVQNIAYSFWLKKVAYADVGCIALGFVLGVVAGGLATRIQVSGYLLTCTALLALFLSFGKRSHELAGLALASTKKQRATLEAYKPESLRRALAITGAASIATCIAYTIDPGTREMFHSNWLWLTAPNPVFGVLRFLHLVRSRAQGREPYARDAARRAVHAQLAGVDRGRGRDCVQAEAERGVVSAPSSSGLLHRLFVLDGLAHRRFGEFIDIG